MDSSHGPSRFLYHRIEPKSFRVAPPEINASAASMCTHSHSNRASANAEIDRSNKPFAFAPSKSSNLSRIQSPKPNNGRQSPFLSSEVRRCHPLHLLPKQSHKTLLSQSSQRINREARHPLPRPTRLDQQPSMLDPTSHHLKINLVFLRRLIQGAWVEKMF